MAGQREDVTRALQELASGGPDSQERLLELVYGELKRIAGAKMGGQGREHTLQPTALVHEAYVRLIGNRPDVPAYADRAHFFTAAAASMRSILVDHARKKGADKRGEGAPRITLHPELAGLTEPHELILAVHEAVERLADDSPRTAQVVELLFFAGLGVDEAAEALGVSGRTVKREWRFARALLQKSLNPS